jgi:hypothetical protein
MRGVRVSWFVATAVAAALWVFSIPAWAADFQADMVQHVSGQSKPGKIYVKGSKYRIVQREEGHEVVVIVDQTAGRTRVLNTATKSYMELAVTDPWSLMNDPFQSVKYAMSRYDDRNLGTETVNGYLCDKVLISSGGKNLMTQWVSQKLKFPVKIVTHTDEDTFAELRNIQEGPVADSLFQVPVGYAKMASPEKGAGETPAPPAAPVPDWAGSVASAPTVQLPYQRSMSAGEIIRVKVQVGKVIYVEGRNEIAGPSTFLVVPFLAGKPIKDPSKTVQSLSREGQGAALDCYETTKQADEIVIRVQGGKVIIKVKYES